MEIHTSSNGFLNNPELITKFEKKIKYVGSCWVWDGTGNPITGYGTANMKGKQFLAHRLAYLLYHGDLIKGQHIDHLCRNKQCVNPKHLDQVSPRENLVRAGFGKPLSNKCPHGHDYTRISEFVGGRTRYRRICKICIQARRMKKTNITKTDEFEILKNMDLLFAAQTIHDETKQTTIDQIMRNAEVKFDPSNFKTAIRVMLAMKGIMTYGKKVVRACKYIDKLTTTQNIRLEDIAAYYDFTITKTRLDMKKGTVKFTAHGGKP